MNAHQLMLMLAAMATAGAVYFTVRVVLKVALEALRGKLLVPTDYNALCAALLWVAQHHIPLVA